MCNFNVFLFFSLIFVNFYFRNLKYVNVTGLDHIEDFELICLSLEADSPNLYIEGSVTPPLIPNPFNPALEYRRLWL